ncbi:MAG: hypothetical protein LBV73_17920, partial [Paraburkholderia sp.]|nr:hypothetical protein [Paraburkholderia sp.]
MKNGKTEFRKTHACARPVWAAPQGRGKRECCFYAVLARMPGARFTACDSRPDSIRTIDRIRPVQMRAHGYIRHIIATRGTLNISSFSCGYSRRFAPLSLPHELHCSTAMHREAARDCAGAVEGTGRWAAEELEVKKCWSGACAALMVSISAFAHAQAR